MLFLVGTPFFGLVVVTYQIVAQALVQQHSPIDKQGRIMSLFMLGTMGTTPVGGLITGWLTDAVSPRASLALGGVAPFLCAGWILWRASSASRDQFAGPVLSLDDRVDRVDRSHRRGVS